MLVWRAGTCSHDCLALQTALHGSLGCRAPWHCTACQKFSPSSCPFHLKLRNRRQLMPTKALVSKRRGTVPDTARRNLSREPMSSVRGTADCDVAGQDLPKPDGVRRQHSKPRHQRCVGLQFDQHVGEPQPAILACIVVEQEVRLRRGRRRAGRGSPPVDDYRHPASKCHDDPAVNVQQCASPSSRRFWSFVKSAAQGFSHWERSCCAQCRSLALQRSLEHWPRTKMSVQGTQRARPCWRLAG